MPTEREAITKRKAWDKLRATFTGHYYDHGRRGWSCPAVIVEHACGCPSVVVHKGISYCMTCGEPAPDAAGLLGVAGE